MDPTPIKVNNRFATAYDTAKALGVPASRTDQLIEIARQTMSSSVSKKKTRRKNAATSVKRAKAKASKARR